jgi:two-component system nitrate/nitrite response regulator NarL
MMNFVIADDHPFMLHGIADFLRRQGHNILATCTNGEDALSVIRLHNPHYALLDVHMPKMNGLDVLKNIRHSMLPVKVILITMHNESTIYKKAKEYNIDGYVLKNYAEDELINCIQTIEKGIAYISSNLLHDLQQYDACSTKCNTTLTYMEHRILTLIGNQKTSKEIAGLLLLSEKTVEAHRSNIIEKLGLPKTKNILLKYALQSKEQ